LHFVLHAALAADSAAVTGGPDGTVPSRGCASGALASSDFIDEFARAEKACSIAGGEPSARREPKGATALKRNIQI
jgi:hypothetical protein